MSRYEAYGLVSMVGDCRVSQVVDVRKGVHCMIPKSIFTNLQRVLRRICSCDAGCARRSRVAVCAGAAAAAAGHHDLADLKSLVEAVGGDRVEVESIGQPEQDPHSIEVKPAQLARLKQAAMLVRIGLDHEPWLARLPAVSASRRRCFQGRAAAADRNAAAADRTQGARARLRQHALLARSAQCMADHGVDPGGAGGSQSGRSVQPSRRGATRSFHAWRSGSRHGQPRSHPGAARASSWSMTAGAISPNASASGSSRQPSPIRAFRRRRASLQRCSTACAIRMCAC